MLKGQLFLKDFHNFWVYFLIMVMGLRKIFLKKFEEIIFPFFSYKNYIMSIWSLLHNYIISFLKGNFKEKTRISLKKNDEKKTKSPYTFRIKSSEISWLLRPPDSLKDIFRTLLAKRLGARLCQRLANCMQDLIVLCLRVLCPVAGSSSFRQLAQKDNNMKNAPMPKDKWCKIIQDIQENNK